MPNKSNTTNISIRIDKDVKMKADALFEELGMSLTTALNIFIRQSLREGGIPFKITNNEPNRKTVAALLEADRIANDSSIKGFHSVDELLKELNK